MQGGFTRFFYTAGYRAANTLNVYVSKRLSEIMGVQRGSTTQPNQSIDPLRFSPRARASETTTRIKNQVMTIVEGDVVAYNQLMNSDVDLFITKFEQFIKTQNRG